MAELGPTSMISRHHTRSLPSGKFTGDIASFRVFITVVWDTVSDEGSSRQKRVRIHQDEWIWAVPDDGGQDNGRDELEDAAQTFVPSTSLQALETGGEMAALVDATAAAAEESSPTRQDSPATKRQRLLCRGGDSEVSLASKKNIIRIRPGLRHNLQSAHEPPSVYVTPICVYFLISMSVRSQCCACLYAVLYKTSFVCCLLAPPLKSSFCAVLCFFKQ